MRSSRSSREGGHKKKKGTRPRPRPLTTSYHAQQAQTTCRFRKTRKTTPQLVLRTISFNLSARRRRITQVTISQELPTQVLPALSAGTVCSPRNKRERNYCFSLRVLSSWRMIWKRMIQRHRYCKHSCSQFASNAFVIHSVTGTLDTAEKKTC